MGLEDLDYTPIIEWVRKQIEAVDSTLPSTFKKEQKKKNVEQKPFTVAELKKKLSEAKQMSDKVKANLISYFNNNNIQTNDGITFRDYIKAKDIVEDSPIDAHNLVFHNIIGDRIYTSQKQKTYDKNCKLTNEEQKNINLEDYEEKLTKFGMLDVLKLTFLYIGLLILYIIINAFVSFAKFPITGIVMKVVSPLINLFYKIKDRLPFDPGLKLNLPDSRFQECKYKYPIFGWRSVPTPVYIEKKCWDKREYEWDNEKNDIVKIEADQYMKNLSSSFVSDMTNVVNFQSPVSCKQRYQAMIKKFEARANSDVDNTLKYALDIFNILRFANKHIDEIDNFLNDAIDNVSYEGTNSLARELTEIVNEVIDTVNSLLKSTDYILHDKLLACCLLKNLISFSASQAKTINDLKKNIRTFRMILRIFINIETINMSGAIINLTEILQTILISIIMALASAFNILLSAVKKNDPFLKKLQKLKFTKNGKLKTAITECLPWNHFIDVMITLYSDVIDKLFVFLQDVLRWVINKNRIAHKTADRILKILPYQILHNKLKKIENVISSSDTLTGVLSYYLNCLDTKISTEDIINTMGGSDNIGYMFDTYGKLTNDGKKYIIDKIQKEKLSLVNTLKKAGFDDNEIIYLFSRDPKTGSYLTSNVKMTDPFFDIFGNCGLSSSVGDYKEV